MSFPTSLYCNIPSCLIPQNYKCQLCNKSVSNDGEKAWIFYSNPDNPYFVPLIHRVCAIQKVLLPSDSCRRNHASNLFLSLSTKEKIGLALLQNVEPKKITIIAAGFSSAIVGGLALLAVVGALKVGGPHSIKLVMQVSGIESVIETVVAVVIVIFIVTVVISEVGYRLLES